MSLKLHYSTKFHTIVMVNSFQLIGIDFELKCPTMPLTMVRIEFIANMCLAFLFNGIHFIDASYRATSTFEEVKK